MTKELNCTCKHEFQDEMYGKGKRLFNQMGDSGKKWRCTVCGKEVSFEEKKK